MGWVHDRKSLRDFISLVIVHAPDDFPVEDYLGPDEQLNLYMAFNELRNGIGLLASSGVDAEQIKSLLAILDSAYAEYQAGNDIKEAHALHEFESRAFQGS